MLTIIVESLDILCPFKSIRIQEDQEDWFDGELLREIRNKNKLHQKACITQNLTDWELSKVAKRNVRKLILKKKRNYITGKLNENYSTPKKFWKEVNKNLSFGQKKSSCGKINIKNPEGLSLMGKDAAIHMNIYYRDIGAVLAEKFNTVWSIAPSLQEYIGPKMDFRFMTIREITAIVKSLCINKSSYVDNISSAYLKDALICTIVELTYILNRCLDESIMPLKWKIGTITPVPKIGPSRSVSDYRPISCLPLPSKIIERAVYNQIIYHLECEGLLDNRQHGFRKNHSTCSAIFEFVQFLYDRLDNRQYISCVFIDYSKAFDTIDHSILCKKLMYYGLSNKVISWCIDYLKDRKQCVSLEGEKSDFVTVKCGVPQGSILGPLFFIIYVNDMIKSIASKTVRITLYADDTVLYSAHEDPIVACNNILNGLHLVHKWCNKNKLTINVKKTKHMFFMPKRRPCDTIIPTVKLNDVILENVDCYNYLGVLIDNNLKFEFFLKNKCKRINQCIYQLGKMRKYVNNNIACTIYKQTIVPLFDYADFLVDSGPKYYVDRLDTLHEKAICIIDSKGFNDICIKESEVAHRLLPPRMRRDEHQCSIMYRLSRTGTNLEMYRPNIHLRSRKKI